MPIRRLSHIPALAQTFVAANVRASNPPAAHHNPVLLQKVSIWSVQFQVVLLLNCSLLSYRQGDITEVEVDVIANAANKSLLGVSSTNTEQ